MKNNSSALCASLAVLFAMLFATAECQTLKSATRFINFTANYSMEYYTHNLGNVPKVRFTLRMKDVDVTTWTTQGKQGLWLGVGFGKQVMDGSDIVHCQYTYSNQSTVDKFVCNDRYASGYQLPPLDTQRDTIDIDTRIAYKYLGGLNFMTFEAIFDRPCNSGDSNDF